MRLIGERTTQAPAGFATARRWRTGPGLRLIIRLLLRRVLEARALRGHVHHTLLLLARLTDCGELRVVALLVHRREGVVVGGAAVLDALVGQLLLELLLC
jgi:hypothetical protein